MKPVQKQTVQPPVVSEQPKIVKPIQDLPTQRKKTLLIKRLNQQYTAGCVQIFAAVINSIFTFFISGVTGGSFWYAGAVLWCAVWPIAAGTLGIKAGKTERPYFTKACLGLSICACFFGGLWSMSMWAVANNIDTSGRSADPDFNDNPPVPSTVLVFLSIFIGLIQLVSSTVQAAFCCCVGGCGDCSGSDEPIVVCVQQSHQPQEKVGLLTSGPKVVIQ